MLLFLLSWYYSLYTYVSALIVFCISLRLYSFFFSFFFLSLYRFTLSCFMFFGIIFFG